MAPRVTSDLLLVGSLPAATTEEALRAAGPLFGDLVFALPDGETGPRASWVGYERERLVRPHPDVDTVKETESPTGIPRHAYADRYGADHRGPRHRPRPLPRPPGLAHRTPLVLGMPLARGSGAAAVRSARANALNWASTM